MSSVDFQPIFYALMRVSFLIEHENCAHITFYMGIVSTNMNIGRNDIYWFIEPHMEASEQ